MRAVVQARPVASGKSEGAGAILQEARRYHQAEAWTGPGRCMQAGGAFRAAELRPDHRGADHSLYRGRRRPGDLDAARMVLDQALDPQPEDGAALANLARLLAVQGWSEQALQVAQHACTLLPGRYDAGWSIDERHQRDPEHLGHDFSLPARDGAFLPEPGRVLVWREHEAGNKIRFCSLLPEVMTAGHQGTLLCGERPRPAFSCALPWLFRRSGATGVGRRPHLSADPMLRARHADGRHVVGPPCYPRPPAGQPAGWRGGGGDEPRGHHRQSRRALRWCAGRFLHPAATLGARLPLADPPCRHALVPGDAALAMRAKQAPCCDAGATRGDAVARTGGMSGPAGDRGTHPSCCGVSHDAKNRRRCRLQRAASPR